MDNKTLIRCRNTVLLGLIFSYVCGIHSVKAEEDLDWSQVKLSIAMFRTSVQPHCPGNCWSGKGRASKVRLSFPETFVTFVEEKMQVKGVGKAYFSVSFDFRAGEVYEQKIYFDFNKRKALGNGLLAFIRSSNYGTVEGFVGGLRCADLKKVNKAYNPQLNIFEGLRIGLNYVRIENDDASDSITLYPFKRKLWALSTCSNSNFECFIFSCVGDYSTASVEPH